MQLSIIVPSYNEAKNLEILLPSWVELCQEHGFKLIIVDDGSSDESSTLLADYSKYEFIKVIVHKINRGYGAAIKTGIRAVDTKYLITLDADGQHDSADIIKLIRVIQDKNVDMVVGKRVVSIDTLYRKVGKWLILWVARLLLPISITDINSGMKIYRADYAKRYLSLYPNSMSFNIIPLVFISQGHLVIESPINVVKRHSGKSKVANSAGFIFIIDLLNMVMLFNPMRIFSPISLTLVALGVVWGLPIVFEGNGVSIGAMMSILTGILFFLMGLMAEQLAFIRKNELNE